MPPLRSLRVFVHTHKYLGEKQPTLWRDWATIGLEYALAFKASGLPVRLVSLTGGAYLVSDEKWNAVQDLFQSEYNFQSFVNVVVGFTTDFKVFWTPEVPNIAITGCTPRVPVAAELSHLHKYRVYSISEHDRRLLEDLGLKVAGTLPPDPNVLRVVFAPLLEVCQ